MKQRKIDELIEQSGNQGFDFENGKTAYYWTVALYDDKMLARRSVLAENDIEPRTKCYAIPYIDMDAIDDLYCEIIYDFVECYAEDMLNGTLADWSVFEDVAGYTDADFQQLLSFFGKTYAEFVADVFLQFAYWQELEELLSGSPRFESPEEKAEWRLVNRVLQRINGPTAFISYYSEFDEMSGVNWEFAVARGELWYARTEVAMNGGWLYVLDDDYGHFDLNDEDALLALQDVIMADINGYECHMETDPDFWKLLDLEVDSEDYSD